jgi:hypothetical protein
VKSDEDLWQICLDIYNELYEEATPSADFNQLKEGKFNKEADHDDEHPYRDYFLQEERQREIVDKHVEKHDLTDLEESKVTTEIYLGASPVGTKTAWRGERNES